MTAPQSRCDAEARGAAVCARTPGLQKAVFMSTVAGRPSDRSRGGRGRDSSSERVEGRQKDKQRQPEKGEKEKKKKRKKQGQHS